VREVIVQDEQNPLVGILLADPFETVANPFFRLILREAHDTLAVERVEPDRWLEDVNQRSGDMWIVHVIQPL
jgi:hypothetical protein